MRMKMKKKFGIEPMKYYRMPLSYNGLLWSEWPDLLKTSKYAKKWKNILKSYIC